MNPTALANLASMDMRTFTCAAVSELNSLHTDRSGLGGPASSELSSFAEVLSVLQRLQHHSPAQYAQVTMQIANQLQSASQTARAEGNRLQALRLSSLSEDFNSAAIKEQLPMVTDLAEALSENHRHHPYHDSSRASSSNISMSRSKDLTGLTNSMWSRVSTSWAAMSAAAESVTQLLTVSVAKSAWTNSLKPMNIIMSVRQQWLNLGGLIHRRTHLGE